MSTPNQKNKMNYLDIQNNFLTVTPYKNNVEEIIAALNEYIEVQDCAKLSIDISSLSLVDCLKAGTLCSTSHFIKYPFGAIEWIVKDIETKNLLKTLSLKTVKTTIKKPIIKDTYPVKMQKVIALR